MPLKEFRWYTFSWWESIIPIYLPILIRQYRIFTFTTFDIARLAEDCSCNQEVDLTTPFIVWNSAWPTLKYRSLSTKANYLIILQLCYNHLEVLEFILFKGICYWNKENNNYKSRYVVHELMGSAYSGFWFQYGFTDGCRVKHCSTVLSSLYKGSLIHGYKSNAITKIGPLYNKPNRR